MIVVCPLSGTSITTPLRSRGITEKGRKDWKSQRIMRYITKDIVYAWPGHGSHELTHFPNISMAMIIHKTGLISISSWTREGYQVLTLAVLLPVNSFWGWKRLTSFSGVDTGKLSVYNKWPLTHAHANHSVETQWGVCPLPERRGSIGKKEVCSGRGREMREGKEGENY